MPKFEVDVRKVDVGVVHVTADNEADALKKVARGLCRPVAFWTSLELQPLCARPKDFQQDIDKTLSNL